MPSAKFRPFRSCLQISITAGQIQISIGENQSNAVKYVNYLKEINYNFCPTVVWLTWITLYTVAAAIVGIIVTP